MASVRSTALASVALAAASVGLLPATGAEAATRISHTAATGQLTQAGIPWSSPGNCSDRADRTCTSFEQVRQSTIDGVVTLKKYSGCHVTVTGGTEYGHSTSTTYSHWNGWKLDLRLTDCLDSYVRKHFTYLGLRGDGWPHWKAASGNIYTKEGTHWDVLYYTAGD